MAAVEVKNLVKNYGELKAVKGINFNINQGEIFGLIGPNGAGKTYYNIWKNNDHGN